MTLEIILFQIILGLDNYFARMFGALPERIESYMSPSLMEIYERLFERFGPQNWWPGETPFEIVVGAILTQNTAWRNVEKAIENLREAGALTVQAMRALSFDELANLIRPAGYYRLKSKRLSSFLSFLCDEFEGDLNRMMSVELRELRGRLLRINGIGPETADSILLYACKMPSFVVDAYTARVFKRHGWLEPESDYHTIKDYFESGLPSDTNLFNEYHALIVRVAKEYCGTTPKCEKCPLVDLLPDGRFVELDS